MAKRQFMSNRPVSRVSRKKSVPKPEQTSEKVSLQIGFGGSKLPAPETNIERLLRPLNELIDNERERLSQAHSILRCVHTALEDGGDDSGDPPYYPHLIDLGCKIIWESIDHLDAVHRKRVLEAATRAVNDRHLE